MVTIDNDEKLSYYNYHILYETTNNVNGKKYIGIHSTNNIDDGYLGSGKLLKRAIEKYGSDNFTRVILEEFKSRDLLILAERDAVDINIVESSDYYNLAIGGVSAIDSLILLDDGDSFREHQSNAGKKGALAFHKSMSTEEKAAWHRKGGQVAGKLRRGHKMTDSQLILHTENMKKQALTRRRHKCTLCDTDVRFDGGNLKHHLVKTHGLTQSEYEQYKLDHY